MPTLWAARICGAIPRPARLGGGGCGIPKEEDKLADKPMVLR